MAGSREGGSKRPSLHSEFLIVLVYTLFWRHQCAEVLSWATDAFAEPTLSRANALIMEDGLTWMIIASKLDHKKVNLRKIQNEEYHHHGPLLSPRF